MFSAASRFALRRAATTTALRTNVVQFQQPSMIARALSVSEILLLCKSLDEKCLNYFYNIIVSHYIHST